MIRERGTPKWGKRGCRSVQLGLCSAGSPADRQSPCSVASLDWAFSCARAFHRATCVCSCPIVGDAELSHPFFFAHAVSNFLLLPLYCTLLYCSVLSNCVIFIGIDENVESVCNMQHILASACTGRTPVKEPCLGCLKIDSLGGDDTVACLVRTPPVCLFT